MMISLTGGAAISAISLISRFIIGLAVLILALPKNAGAQPPYNPEIFQAGLYADIDRTVNCVDGPAGTVFRQYLWAWVPPDAGAVYVTTRIFFPDNVAQHGRPIPNALVTRLIITDYGSGGWEWNFLLADCPSGWILLAWQDCLILDAGSSEVRISGESSLARNCATFLLEGLSVLSNLRIGAGTCAPVPVARSRWGAIKQIYR